MSLHIISGLPRNGKSYYCCCRILDDLMQSERHVYTNLPLVPDQIARWVASRKITKSERYLDLLDGVLKRIHIFRDFTCLSEIRDFRSKNPLWCRMHLGRRRKYDDNIPFSEKLLFRFDLVSEYWDHCKANSVYYLDECYQIWNYLDASERSTDAKERRKDLQNYMRMHGHDGDDVFLISHKERDLDRFILDTCSYRINVRNSKYWPIIPDEFIQKYWWLGWLGSLRWPWQFFILHSYIGDEKTPHKRFFRASHRYVFRFYDSNSRPNGLRNRGYDPSMKNYDRGRGYWAEVREWFGDAWPALLILTIAIVSVYHFFVGIRSVIQPKPHETKNVVQAVNPAPAVTPAGQVSQPLSPPVPDNAVTSITPVSIKFSSGTILKKGSEYEHDGKKYNVVSFDRDFVYFTDVDGKRGKLETRRIK